MSQARHTPKPAPDSKGLGDVLSFMRLLWAVAHGLEARSKRMRTELGVTGPQRLVLRLVGHYTELSPGDLAELLHVHPSTLTGILERLERADLLKRRRDPADARRSILSLTAKGRVLNLRRAGTVEDAVRVALAGMSAREVAAAREVLGALARRLDVPETDPPSRRVPRVARSRS